MFLEMVKGNSSCRCFQRKSNAIAKEEVVTSEMVTTSEEVDTGTKKLDDMIEAVVRICRKYLDNFEGQYKGSTSWFNPDHYF